MKANELMIGDWVMVNDVEHTHLLQVAEILMKSGTYYATLYWDGMPDNVNPETLTADVDKVLPIPLTKEILEKNGFEKRWQDNFEYFNDDEGLNITFHPKSSNYTNGAYDYIDIERGCLTINEMPIAFVHELQHALRLCGISKEIEL